MGGLSHRPLPSSVVPNELILFGCWELSLPMTSVRPPIWTKYCHRVLPLYTPYGSFAATASVLSCCIGWLKQPNHVASLMNASPAWWGFSAARDRARIEQLIKKLKRSGFLPQSASVALDLVCDADARACLGQ